MIRLLAITVCVLSWLTVSPSLAEDPQTEEKNVLQEIFSKNRPTSVAGIPYEEALAILKRHEEDLLKLPGVDAIDMDEQGILVYSDNPSVVPSMIEDLPVRITAPLAQTSPSGKATELQGPPPLSDCGPSAHWEPEAGRCKRDTLLPDSLIFPRRESLFRLPLE